MSTVSLGMGAESVYFAQPYNIDAVGFYFTDLADYQDKAAKAVDRYGFPVQEFELQDIDGDYAALFNALSVSQASLADWFELVDEIDDVDDRYVIACHLAGLGVAIGEIAGQWDDYWLYRGTAADYAAEIVADCYEVPQQLEYYIDYERMGRDMVLNGDIVEIERELILIGG